MLSQEWRCKWSSADRWCSNYIWVINNLIAYSSPSYIRDGNHINSLAPKRCGSNSTSAVFKLILQIDNLSTSCGIGLRGVPQNPFDHKSALVQIMLGAIRHHAITQEYVDPDVCWHMASLGHHAVFPLTHNRCEVVISWWSPLLSKISIYATKCESILEKSGIFIHLQSKYCINLSCKKNLTISWVQIAARW